MANASSIKQEIQNNFDTTIATEFDINMSKKCIQSTDASQIIKGIKLEGVSDVDIEQVNKANNACALKTFLDMDIINKLSDSAQGALLDKLETTTGLGVSVVNKDQKIINNIRKNVSLKAAVDLTTTCLQQSLQSQNLENISIKDARNINFSQMNEGFSKCLSEGESRLGQFTETETVAETKVESETVQKGFDPLASLADIAGGFGMLGMIMAASPIIISCVIVMVIVVIMMMGRGGGGSTPPSGDLSTPSLDTPSLDTPPTLPYYDLPTDVSIDTQLSQQFPTGDVPTVPAAYGGGFRGGGQYGGVSEQVLGRTGILIRALENFLAGN